MKASIDPLLLSTYEALKVRRLVRTRNEFVAQFIPNRLNPIFYRRPASAVTLLCLYKALIAKHQVDLAALVHQGLLERV